MNQMSFFGFRPLSLCFLRLFALPEMAYSGIKNQGEALRRGGASGAVKAQGCCAISAGRFRQFSSAGISSTFMTALATARATTLSVPSARCIRLF